MMTGARRIPIRSSTFSATRFDRDCRGGGRATFGVSFSPAASDKALRAIRQTIRGWTLHEGSDKTLDDLARMLKKFPWATRQRRLFCHITQTWRGRPLTGRLAVVDLIFASTTTPTGLVVRCELDTQTYPKGIKVSDEEIASLNIKGDAFHPEWNYTISPRVPP
jgi:hypothetical protein